MNILLTLLPLAIMFSNVRSESSSMSCSTVNGKTVCESQKSSGNVAGASSRAAAGPGVNYQDAGAMTGNTNTGQSSSSFSRAGQPPQGFGFGPGGFPPGGFPSGGFPSGGYPSGGYPSGAFAAGGIAPGGFDPAAFVAGQMGPGFPFAGGFAGAYAFGRR